MPKQTLSHRLYSKPAYRELVKLVGYRGRPFPFSPEESESLFAKYGKDEMKAAADELIDYDQDANLAKLKSTVRGFCFGILGPAPEQEDWYYRHPDGTPFERPTKSPSSSTSEGPAENGHRPPEARSEDVDPAVGSTDAEVPRRMVPPPEMTVEEMLSRLSDDELRQLIDDAQVGLKHHGAKSHYGRLLKRDIASAENECARRREQAGQPSEVDLIRSMHGRKLRTLLLNEHAHCRDYPPGHHFHDEALRRISVLESEMRRRGNKVPPRPSSVAQAVASPLLGGKDAVDDIDVVAQALANSITSETSMGCIVAHPDEIKKLESATTTRLHELLDMDLYEVAKYGPDTVTHQEAAREAALIEVELKRRKAL